MAKISLRSYLQEIGDLIDKGQTEEAIAHCRHILQSYPKLLGAYRLLGKSYLESQRFGDAADIFQRVLSSTPDDFVSHVGMSIVREDEANLDAAIWHMERAFEVQPYNAAIQNELRRLYGRRDGAEPPKVRLTRGALARMYARGHLYQQAIGELRAALAEDSQRPDLQVLLARMYFLSGMKVEAAETCSNLIKKLPYCLEASRILSIILTDTGRKEDAEIYKQRIVALDPYLVYASPQAPSSDGVPENLVSMDKYDYKRGGTPQQGAAQPAWASSLGVSFDTSEEKEPLPEWLSGAEEETQKPKEGYKAPFISEETQAEESELSREQAPQETAPLPDWLSGKEGTEVQEKAASAEAPIPDWMKEAGWGPSTGAAQEAPTSYEPESAEIQPEIQPEGEISKGEIPDWLKAMAPEQVEETPAEDKGEEVLPWLQTTTPGPSNTIIGWLKDKEAQPSQPAEAAPEEMISDLSAEPAAKAEIPDWLKDLGSDEETPAQAPEPPVEEVTKAEIPDWMTQLTPKSEEEAEQIQEIPSTPEWVAAAQAVVEEAPGAEAAAEEVIPEAGPAAEMPDWLQEMSEKAGMSEEPAAPAEAIPDWLKTMAAEIPPEEVTTEEPAPVEAEEVPEPQFMEAVPPEVPTTEVPSVLETTLSSEDAGLAWLESLAAKQGVPEEELITSPEERAEVPPAWLQETAAEAQLITPEPGAEKAEVPDWFKEVEAEVPISEAAGIEAEEPVETAAEQMPVQEAEMPDWLKEIQAETPAEIPTVQADELEVELPAEGGPVELPPVEAEIPDWLTEIRPEAEEEGLLEEAPVAEMPATAEPMEATVSTPDLSDETAALAWLESLAAKQGVPEEELITKPEERLEAPPAWVQESVPQETGPEEAISEAAPEIAEEETPPVEAEIPDWLKEVSLPEEVEAEAPVAESAAPLQAAEPAIEAPGVPTFDSEEAAMAWLESLAARQGAPEEELMTKPEERPAEAPSWVQEAALQEVTPEAPAEVLPPEIEKEAVAEPLDVEVEQPAWMGEVSLPEEPALAVEAAPVETEPAEVIPVESVPIEAVPAETPVEAVSMEPAPIEPVIQETAGVPTFDSEEAAMAWLESLAAKQGAPEEELMTKPEERPSEPPAWVKEAAEEAPIPLEAGAISEQAPVEEQAVEGMAAFAEPEPELPDWLLAAAEEKKEEVWTPPAKPALDINQAGLIELENLPGVGFILAQKILDYRHTNGPFDQVEDLKKVPGVDPALIDSLRDQIKVEPKPVPETTPVVEQALPVIETSPDMIMLNQARSTLTQGDSAAIVQVYDNMIKNEYHLEDVIHDLKEAVKKFPSDFSIWQTLGDAYMRKDQLQEALDAYDKAEQLLR